MHVALPATPPAARAAPDGRSNKAVTERQATRVRLSAVGRRVTTLQARRDARRRMPARSNSWTRRIFVGAEREGARRAESLVAAFWRIFERIAASASANSFRFRCATIRSKNRRDSVPIRSARAKRPPKKSLQKGETVRRLSQRGRAAAVQRERRHATRRASRRRQARRRTSADEIAGHSVLANLRKNRCDRFRDRYRLIGRCRRGRAPV